MTEEPSIAAINARRPRQLTVSQQTAARILDMHVDTVEALVARGVLERVQLSYRRYGIKWSSLLKLVGEAE